MLGVTRQRVGQIVRDDRSFPVNLTRLSSGALWYAAGIEIWIAGHLDRGRQWASHVPRYARELRPEDRHDRDRRPHAEAGSSAPALVAGAATVARSVPIADPSPDPIAPPHVIPAQPNNPAVVTAPLSRPSRMPKPTT